MLIKRAPERWQETTKHFDIVITFDQRVYDMLVEGMEGHFLLFLFPLFIFFISPFPSLSIPTLFPSHTDDFSVREGKKEDKEKGGESRRKVGW